MQIDSGIVGVVVTVLIALLSLSFWVGTLSQRVKQNENGREQNRIDHQLLFSKLEEINRYIRNGKAI